jgi:phage shock protein C
MSDTIQPRKRLYRSRTERMIAGVCGGLGDYFNIDPVWVRVLFLVLLLAAGSTLLVYLIMWLIVPLAPNHTSANDA